MPQDLVVCILEDPLCRFTLCNSLIGFLVGCPCGFLLQISAVTPRKTATDKPIRQKIAPEKCPSLGKGKTNETLGFPDLRLLRP